jgi:membrane-associated phospholipid phosphatase
LRPRAAPAGAGPPAVAPAAPALVAPAAVAFAAVGATAGVYAVFVRTALGQRVDELAMRGADVADSRLASLLGTTVVRASSASLALMVLLVAAVVLARRRLDLAVAAGVAVFGANATTQVLKAGLTRPALETAAANSLPSGHTTAAASLALVLVLVVPRAARAVVAPAGAAYVAVVAVATVCAGWHRPSDAVAAVLVALAWGAVSVAGMPVGTPVGGRAPARPASVLLATVGLAGTAVAVTGLAAVVVAARSGPASVYAGLAFVSGAAGVCATAATALLGWLWLVSADPVAARAQPVVPPPTILARAADRPLDRGDQCRAGWGDRHTVPGAGRRGPAAGYGIRDGGNGGRVLQ